MTPAAVPPSPAATRIRPLRDAVVFGGAILMVAGLALSFTYYFSRRAQIEAVRNELAQLARVVAASVDGDLHRIATGEHMEGTPEYLRALQPIVRFHRATEDVIYVYTYLLHSDGTVRFGLDSAYLYTVPGDDQIYDPPMSTYDGNDPDARRALLTRTLAVNREPTVEEVRTYLSAYAPFYDSKGAFVGVVGVDMWVRQLDERLAGLQRIVMLGGAGLAAISALAGAIVFRMRTHAAAAEVRDRQAVVDLAAAKDAAEQSSRAKSAFLAVMSHELRTPLNGIVGYTELAREELTARGDTALAQDLTHVLTASRHLTALIGDVLDYSRIEAGRLELVPANVDVAAVVGDVVTLLSPGAQGKGVALEAEVHAHVGVVVGDHTRLRQVLLNLVGNAVKFTDAGRITVRVRPGDAGTRVVCTVHDTGIGIAADQRGRLFKPFSQVDGSSTRAAGGTGLGLAICSRLVAAMGGRLTVKSRAGRGSSFRFTLPARQAA